jgi:hypothetical protein
MAEQRLEVLSHAEAVRLAALGGDVADVDLDRVGSHQGTRDAFNHQVWQHAGVKTAGSDHHHVGLQNRLDGLRVGWRVRRLEVNSSNCSRTLGDVRLALDQVLVDQLGTQRDVLQRGRQDLAAYRQDSGRLPNSFLEVAGDARHGHDEQVAETVTLQA